MKNMLGNVRFTSPDRIIYPSLGLTKLDVARYYQAVAPWMLPHVVGRPLALVRCPKGVHPEHGCFFQKHAMKGMSDAVLQVEAPTRDGPTLQLAVDSADGLVGLVQFGVLEFHVWGARYENAERPDRIVVDLDPGPDLRWARVVAAAFWIRKELQKLGLESFAKTTGGKGLHVVVPIQRRNTWEQVQSASMGFGERLAASSPTQFTTDMAKSARKGRILLDCLRNTRGATAVAPYSTRAREGATVSVPVSWKELESLPRGRFHIASVLERLRQFAAGERVDPWNEIGHVRQWLTKSMLAKMI